MSVEIPNFRFETACILAVWSDPMLQQRLWIDGESKGFESLYYQLGDVDDYDLFPSGQLPPSRVLANLVEISTIAALGAALDRVLDLKEFDWNDARPYMAHPLWSDVMTLSSRSLRLIVLDGGCWDDESRELGGSGQVSDVPARSLGTQCLAALAWAGDPAPPEGPPPLLRGAAASAEILVDRLAVAEPHSTVDRIWCDGHQELERVAALGTLINTEAGTQAIAEAADRALWAVVRNRGGWDYTGPVPPRV